jgi:hypothetical protein
MSETDPDKKPPAPDTSSEPDTYDLAFDPDEEEPQTHSAPAAPLPTQLDGSHTVPSTGNPSPATLPEPPSHYIDDPRAASEPTADSAQETAPARPSQYPEHQEPEAVSPAKAEARREEQRVRAAMEQAEADARKKKKILIGVGVAVVVLILIWLLI